MSLLLAPILCPLVAALPGILAWRRVVLQRWLGFAGAGLMLVSAVALLARVLRGGIQSVQVGPWPAPYGITLVADVLSAMLAVVAAVMGVLVLVYGLGSLDREREHWGFHPLFQLLLVGKAGALLTGDLFNLFVWFEVMLIASFALLVLGNHWRQLVGGVKYVAVNLLASALFLSGIGVLYGITGTLNFADLSRKLSLAPEPAVVTPVALLLLVALGVKGAVFPLFFWLPDSYPKPPVAVGTIFAALLTKVAVYAIVRLFTLVFVHDPGFTHSLLLGAAGLTMLTGVLGAVSEWHFRRLLSFHIVSQIGYLLMGVALASRLALAGAVYFFAHVIFAKSALFLVSGITGEMQGTHDVRRLGGHYAEHPGLALLFLVPALSLAGVPPFSGFFAKLSLVQAGLLEGEYPIALVAVVVGLLTLYSMAKVWVHAFWTPAPQESPRSGRLRSPVLWYAPIAVLAALMLGMGLGAGPLFRIAEQAADQLLDPSAYIYAVLGEAS